MKTQQELMQAYWGPGGTVDMVKEYNAKHGTNIQPWECIRYTSAVKFHHTNHPGFASRRDEPKFAITILYDDKLKEHRPVFAGDKVYDKKIPKELEVIDSDTLQYGVLKFTDLDWDKISWNPPTPKKWYRVAEMRDGTTVTADHFLPEENIRGRPGFVKWLDERKYYD